MLCFDRRCEIESARSDDDSISVIELVPESYLQPLDLADVFGRVAPLEVDLGCAEGSFLIALAERHPDKNYLGIERMSGRVARACRKGQRSSSQQVGDPTASPARTDNVRIINVETSYAVRYLLPEESVETFYLFFPDPWPKRRHQRRRVVSPEFLQSIHRALAPEGLFKIATDQEDYFQQIQQLAGEASFAEIENAGESLPTTRFERVFQKKGAPIYRLSLRKISPVK